MELDTLTNRFHYSCYKAVAQHKENYDKSIGWKFVCIEVS